MLTAISLEFNTIFVGAQNLLKQGIKLKHIFTLSEVVNCLSKHKKIDESFVSKVCSAEIIL